MYSQSVIPSLRFLIVILALFLAAGNKQLPRGFPAGSEPDWLPPGHLVNCFLCERIFPRTISCTVAISIKRSATDSPRKTNRDVRRGGSYYRRVIFLSVSLRWNSRRIVDVVKIKPTWNLSASPVGNISIAFQLTFDRWIIVQNY